MYYIYMYMMMLIFFLFIAIVVINMLLALDSSTSGIPPSQKQIHDAYKNFFQDIRENYNQMLRPSFGGKPVEVEVSMHVNSLRSISEKTMDYKVELYYREHWFDDRLMFDPQIFNLTTMNLQESFVNILWVPDTFLVNAIHSNNPEANSISHKTLLRLNSNGKLLYSRRLSIVAECPMDLSLYPFDQQVCQISLESYAHPVDEIVYDWKKENGKIMVDLNPNLELPNYKVRGIRTANRNTLTATGNYSRLELCFIFRRSAGFYFVQFLIPATAIVITSWCALWMDKESTFSDTIAVLLSIIFLYYSYSTVMPKVSYIKAMDIYLGGCFIFVFLALVKMACLKLLKESLFHENDLRETTSAFVNSNHDHEGRAQRTSDKFECEEMVKENDKPLAMSSRKWQFRVKMLNAIRKSSYFMLPCMFFILMIVYSVILFTFTSDRDKGICEFE